MGTLNFTVTKYGRQGRHSGGASIAATEVITSDAHTTSTAASNVADGSGAITLALGQVFRCHADEPMWVNFGGAAATVGDGFFIPADQTSEFECTEAGTVSAIDVA